MNVHSKIQIVDIRVRYFYNLQTTRRFLLGDGCWLKDTHEDNITIKIICFYLWFNSRFTGQNKPNDSLQSGQAVSNAEQ